MKFEQLLQIYWSRGFLYGGATHKFDINLKDFFESLPGLNEPSKNLFVKRFELNVFKASKAFTFTELKLDFRKVINMYLSQLTSINNHHAQLIKYNIIRLYLIKSFRGRAHALGKPTRGQRTWSNAATSYIYNRVLRSFISDVRKLNVVKKAPKVLNFKRLKKKVKKVAVKIKMQVEKKQTNFWF